MIYTAEKKAVTGLQNSPRRRVRIAWIGDVGGGGGVPGMATQLVAALSAQECEGVVFSRTHRQEIERVFSREVLSNGYGQIGCQCTGARPNQLYHRMDANWR